MLSRAALLIVPIVVAMVIAIGLHIGAGSTAVAALVYRAPFTKEGTSVWQIQTFRDHLSSRETESVKMHVTLDEQGRPFEQTIESNVDGIAELPVRMRPNAIEI